MTLRNDVVPVVYFSAASNALWIRDDIVPGIGEAKRGSEGKTSITNPSKSNQMGSTMYLLILMQHVVPELGLAEVIVATGKPATPHQATASNG